MDPINRLNSLTELIRKRVASEAAAKREGRPPLQQRNAAQTGGPERADIAALRNRISDTVRAINPDDPGRNQKAMQAFVENVLAWQFGDNILNDPGFTNLVAEVQAMLEKDSATAGVFEAMMTEKPRSPS